MPRRGADPRRQSIFYDEDDEAGAGPSNKPSKASSSRAYEASDDEADADYSGPAKRRNTSRTKASVGAAKKQKTSSSKSRAKDKHGYPMASYPHPPFMAAPYGYPYGMPMYGMPTYPMHAQGSDDDEVEEGGSSMLMRNGKSGVSASQASGAQSYQERKRRAMEEKEAKGKPKPKQVTLASEVDPGLPPAKQLFELVSKVITLEGDNLCRRAGRKAPHVADAVQEVTLKFLNVCEAEAMRESRAHPAKLRLIKKANPINVERQRRVSALKETMDSLKDEEAMWRKAQQDCEGFAQQHRSEELNLPTKDRQISAADVPAWMDASVAEVVMGNKVPDLQAALEKTAEQLQRQSRGLKAALREAAADVRKGQDCFSRLAHSVRAESVVHADMLDPKVIMRNLTATASS